VIENNADSFIDILRKETLNRQSKKLIRTPVSNNETDRIARPLLEEQLGTCSKSFPSKQAPRQAKSSRSISSLWRGEFARQERRLPDAIKKLRSREEQDTPPGGGAHCTAVCSCRFHAFPSIRPRLPRSISRLDSARERLNSPGENGNGADETHQS